ncbi:MAG: hypothetical protein FJ100_11750 [Deltaproteobacteria bacterium]|nr:hypothetical protein [Deltaproteobacteria bacterium]
MGGRAHLVWLGPRLPDLGWLAARSALARGGFSQVQLWGDAVALQADAAVRSLAAPGLVIRNLADLDEGSPQDGADARLRYLCATLPGAAARADVWRLRIVRAEGGVYLDCDAIVLRSFEPLLALPAFVGLEYVCLPAALYGSRNPLRWARAAGLLALRHAVTRGAGAGRRFAAVAGLFDLACNNAVFGAQPGSAFVRALCDAAAALPDRQAQTLYELGPRLFERATGNRSSATCDVLPPSAFYPLGPEVCADYVAADPQGRLGHTPHPDSYAAHLYDSVVRRRLGRQVDLRWLAGPGRATMLGRMVGPWLAELQAVREADAGA